MDVFKIPISWELRLEIMGGGGNGTQKSWEFDTNYEGYEFSVIKSVMGWTSCSAGQGIWKINLESAC